MDYELKQTIKDRLVELSEEAITEIGNANTVRSQANDRNRIYTNASYVVDDVLTLQQAGISFSDALMILILCALRKVA